jgi:hypothetical protein
MSLNRSYHGFLIAAYFFCLDLNIIHQCNYICLFQIHTLAPFFCSQWNCFPPKMRYDANHIFICARDTSRVQSSGMGGAGQKIGFPEIILCAANFLSCLFCNYWWWNTFSCRDSARNQTNFTLENYACRFLSLI